jgi:hypothetical protein
MKEDIKNLSKELRELIAGQRKKFVDFYTLKNIINIEI